jgi:hypothetical protein
MVPDKPIPFLVRNQSRVVHVHLLVSQFPRFFVNPGAVSSGLDRGHCLQDEVLKRSDQTHFGHGFSDILRACSLRGQPVSMQRGNRKLAIPDRKLQKPNRKLRIPDRELRKPNRELGISDRELQKPNRKLAISDRELQKPNRKLAISDREL